ncbi:hypothetical protein pipiens_004610 [Culex pipiens pipiens]|uniref:Uncharacterized protein n=1 Tax=Culex pipiens pipiens TaxID=38569 RepID=A0ABD1CH59_CULPP
MRRPSMVLRAVSEARPRCCRCPRPVVGSVEPGGGTGGLSSPTDDSADEDMPVCREKPPRPQHVRRKRKEKDMSPVLEEDIVDGFAILAFKTYEDLEYAIKLANKRNEKRLSSIVELTSIMVDDKPPKIIDTTAQKMDQQKANSERLAAEAAAWSLNNNNNNNNGTANGSSNGSSTAATATNLSLPPNVDPGTSDDSGRASERLTTSSVAQRDPDSSRDRLSDASSRCSSGKGYICDSEGDDDKREALTDIEKLCFVCDFRIAK